jgi:hypothetical protein
VKVESAIMPQPYEIRQRQDNLCDIIFAQSVQEVKKETGVSYEYEAYALTTRNRSDLDSAIESNYDAWLNIAIEYERSGLETRYNMLCNERIKSAYPDGLEQKLINGAVIALSRGEIPPEDYIEYTVQKERIKNQTYLEVFGHERPSEV